MVVLVILFEGGFVFEFAGVGFLGAVDAVCRMESGAEHFLLAFTVTTTHGLNDIIQADFSFLFFFIHTSPFSYL